MVGVIGMGGVAIRARYRNCVPIVVLMPTISARQKSICAGAKPTIPIAATLPACRRWRETREPRYYKFNSTLRIFHRGYLPKKL